MIAAIYARVSTEEQSNDMQLTDLHAWAVRMGWQHLDYLEKESSVRKRPVFERMMADAKQRKFDVVITWKIDRLCRSMKTFIQTMLELDSYGVSYRAITQNCSTDQRDPMGKLVIGLFALLAEFERDMLVERVTAGVKQYRRAYREGAVGKQRHSHSGKDLPHGRPRKVFRRDLARQMRAQGISWRKIAAELGIPRSVLQASLANEPR